MNTLVYARDQALPVLAGSIQVMSEREGCNSKIAAEVNTDYVPQNIKTLNPVHVGLGESGVDFVAWKIYTFDRCTSAPLTTYTRARLNLSRC